MMNTRIEKKRIAARIKQLNGIMQNINNGTRFDSYVHFKDIQQVIYITSNIRVIRTMLENETYDSTVGRNRYQEPWDQINYFVSTDVHPLGKADSYGYSPNDNTNKQNDPVLAFSYIYFAQRGQSTTLKLHYIWLMKQQRLNNVGLVRRSFSTENSQYTVRIQTIVPTRQ